MRLKAIGERLMTKEKELINLRNHTLTEIKLENKHDDEPRAAWAEKLLSAEDHELDEVIASNEIIQTLGLKLASELAKIEMIRYLEDLAYNKYLASIKRAWSVDGTDMTINFNGDGNCAYIKRGNSTDWTNTDYNREFLTELVADHVKDIYEKAIADYVEPEPVEAYFENEDIVITDPCYVLPNDTRFIDTPGRRDSLNNKPIPNSIVTETSFGDGGWTVYKGHLSLEYAYGLECENSVPVYGETGADSGSNGVFSVKDVLALNEPGAKENMEKDWIATIIKGFTGKVEVIHVPIGHVEWGRTHYTGIKGTGNKDFVVYFF